jgi:gamma-polyglutamate biosynthesis protein CapA
MKKWLLLPIALILLAGAFFFFSLERRESKIIFPEATEEKLTANGFHSAFHMDKEFYGNLEGITQDWNSGEQVYGGITSHHFLAAKEIARFFLALNKKSPRTIAIIGPNHFNVGGGDIMVSKYPFKTPWGNVYPDESCISGLIEKKAALNEEEPFSMEHSISALVGFMKFYLPDAKIVPIIVKRGTNLEKAENLAKTLDKILPDDAVVISSVDFSHHLNKTASVFHDAKSISAIRNFEYERILESEVDSPVSIYSLLRYLDMRSAHKLDYKNMNSADFSSSNLSDDVTSYFFAHFGKGNVQADKKISVLSFGDMMFGRDIAKSIGNGLDPFDKIKGPEGNFLRGVDFISANLEGPITETIECSGKTYAFKFNPDVAVLLAKHGVNIVNLANNHTGDCGQKAFEDTERLLSKRNISFFGGHPFKKSYIEKEVNGKKIVFLGIDLTDHSNNLEQYYDLIRKKKESGSYVIANVHWGYEYHSNPSQNQKDIAHFLIDVGTDIVIGHHPHVVQPVEIYKDKAIFYSLGNFIFDQIGTKENEGVGLGAVMEKEKIRYFIFPYEIKNYQPALFSAGQAKIFCDNYLSGIQGRSGCEFEIESAR